MSRNLVLRTVVLLSTVLFPLISSAESRIALVIGNAGYSGSISPLANPANDATDVAGKLRENGWNVILATDANRRDMSRKLNEFRDALKSTPESTALFFYAGHGVQIEGKNYLIPLGEEFEVPDDVKENAFLVDRVLDVFDEAKIKQSVIFLDACRDNPFSRRSRSLGSNRGLAFIPASENAEEGSAVIFSTGANEVASDGEGRNGLFTSVLLDYIDTGLELTALFKKVRDDVKAKSFGKQVPSIVTSGILSGIYLGQTNVALRTPVVVVPEVPPLIQLKLNTSVVGLTVTIDDRPVGVTPFEAQIPQGVHTVVLTNPDWNSWSGFVPPGKTGTVVLTPQLVRSNTGQIKDLALQRQGLVGQLGLTQESERLWGNVQLGGWITAGLGTALAVGGFIYGVTAKSSYDSATTASGTSDARQKASTANIVYQTGLLSGGAGLVVALVSNLIAPSVEKVKKQIGYIDSRIQKLEAGS